MKIFLNLVFAFLLVGCQKSDTKPQSSDCRMFRFTPEGKICISEQSLWLEKCVVELVRNKSNEVRWFNGIGANDATFIPKTNPAEEIFLKCNSVNPVSADKAPIYQKWIQDRISEIQSITPVQTRRKVNQILRQNGGVFTPSAIIYSHKECDVLKVRIEFEPVSSGDEGFSLNENDEVKSVSMPYLGLFNCD